MGGGNVLHEEDSSNNSKMDLKQVIALSTTIEQEVLTYNSAHEDILFFLFVSNILMIF